jgi:transketolase
VKTEATRAAYGRALETLGHSRTDVVVLDADLSGSTKTAAFGKSFPDRFFNMGVAECNMMGFAAGLALSGKTVFASSFAMFAAGKAWEQIRQSICVPNLNVKIVASHAGITVGEDGASHQMLEDIALMRVLPRMKVVVPADSKQTEAALEAIATTEGPCYMRTSRAATPVMDDAPAFVFGKAVVHRKGSDLALVACGVEVYQCLLAADELSEEGVECTIVDCATVDPLDAETVCEAARNCGRVMTVEEHQIVGGLGEAVAGTLLENGALVPMRRHGMTGQFGQTGPAASLLHHYHLDGPGIAEKARRFLGETR